MKAPSIGDQVEFTRAVRKGRTVELTSCKGTVWKTRTVKQVFVVVGKRPGSWVDVEVIEQDPKPSAGKAGG